MQFFENKLCLQKKILSISLPVCHTVKKIYRCKLFLLEVYKPCLIFSLPKVVKRRIKALKKLQFEMIKIESKFYEEVHALECRYGQQYAPLIERVSFQMRKLLQ